MSSLSYAITHLLLPGYSNNQKAKILHSESITIIVFLLIIGQFLIGHISSVGIAVLGYASQISTSDVIKLTNDQREALGENPLTYNEQLTQAAKAKGEDMLAKGYWAHVAPDGTQPWKFFNDVGYKYRYAGENLAKDFPSAQAAVDAWMASPSHKENMLSTKYDDIGVAVVEGNLNGVDTTIIVQLFGRKYDTSVAAATTTVSAKSENSVAPAVSVSPTVAPTYVPSPTMAIQQTGTIAAGESGKPTPFQVLVSPFSTKKGFSEAAVAILLITFGLDAVLILRRRTPRVGSKTFAHIIFLVMILAIVILVQSGEIIKPIADALN